MSFVALPPHESHLRATRLPAPLIAMIVTADGSFRALVAGAVLLLSTSGCYRQVPTEGGPATLNRELVFELSERGRMDLAPQLGADLQRVAGRVTAFEGEVYSLAVTQTHSRGGIETLWRGERATIPRAYVVTVAERRLDKRRTWIAAGLSVLGVVIAGKAFGLDGGLGNLIGRGEGSPQ